MNIIAVMSERGAFFKEEPLRQLQDTLEQKGFEVVLPSDREDLIKLLENNPRICGVIFDWDLYSLELCAEISQLNEHLPVYAFANTHSTLDVSLNDLRLNVTFFEYALDTAADIALKIEQKTDEYINTILPPLTKAL
ncbi:lysine decarboxylase LdcC, partial [Vibrio cholerae]|nr:lysine decarboxylase LdcC [Vibrio cholerae]